MTRSPYLSTSQVAKAAGVHPNTVRLYEEWGFLPPIPRGPNGYRRFTQAHIDQMILARLAMRFTWLSGEFRATCRQVIFLGAAGDLEGALAQARRLLKLIQAEQRRAEAAAAFLERWVRGDSLADDEPRRQIGETAQLLEVSRDRLRNWEVNGLIRVPRHPDNGYRLYGAVEIGRLRVIHSLRSARYSLMSILRMLTRLDQGETHNLRQVLDTPRPDETLGENAIYATDHWLSTLEELDGFARELVAYIEKILDSLLRY